MRKLLALALLAFCVVLAIIVGQRMSTDAMAVVIGVVVGVGASVPTSLLLVALLRRERASVQNWRHEPPAQSLPSPNLIVLSPADFLAGRITPSQVPMPSPELELDGGMRRLRVVGDEEEWG
jgi:hypothetical protein